MAKSNATYWKERFEALEDTQYKKSKQYYQDIEKQFRMATNNVQMDIEKWYTRLAENNNISYASAKRLLKKKELEEFHWTLEEYIKKGQENAVNQRWMKELENASARVHIERLEAMKIQMQQHAEVLSAQYLNGTTNFLRNTYADNFYRTAYEIQKGIGIGSNLTRLDTRTIDKIIQQPWASDGANFSDRIWSNKDKLVRNLHTELTQSIIRGENPSKAAERLAKIMGVSKAQANRLVMTESAAISSSSQKDCLNELGVEKYEILATLDSRTSDICQDMDGKVFDMKNYQVGLTAPPFHPNCRSTTVPYFNDEFTEDEVRAARDENGGTYYVPADMKYQEWKEKYVHESDWNEHKVSSNGLDNQFSVNRSIVNSKAFTDKFNGIGKNSKIDTVLRNETIDILDHRNGSKLEDVVYLDERTGKRIFLNNSSSESLGITLTLAEKEKILKHKGNIITIHNHPYGSRPSIGDIITMQRTKDISKIVVAGHNGKIYTISNINRSVDIKNLYEKELQYYKMIYSGDIYMAQEKATQAIYDMNLFEFLER